MRATNIVDWTGLIELRTFTLVSSEAYSSFSNQKEPWYEKKLDFGNLTFATLANLLSGDSFTTCNEKSRRISCAEDALYYQNYSDSHMNFNDT